MSTSGLDTRRVVRSGGEGPTNAQGDRGGSKCSVVTRGAWEKQSRSLSLQRAWVNFTTVLISQSKQLSTISLKI